MNRKKCCGCSACVTVCPKSCITMVESSEGFLYPQKDSTSCIECNLCEKVCPIGIEKKIQEENHLKVYACINNTDEIRMNSSSGGVFFLLAEYILDKNGKVYGAVFDKDWSVCHIGVDNIEELEKIQGSKYLQSDKKYIFKEVKKDLETGKKVLFSGTPCEVAGLRNYLGKEYENLYCADVVCHGVPSPKVWQKYLQYIEKMVKKPCDRESTPSHRSKTDGWSRFSVSIPLGHDTEYLQEHDKDLYMRTFLKDIILRPSCYECQCKPSINISDISLADFWGVENVLPDFYDDKGTSLVLINTEKGNKLFREICKYLKYQDVSYETALKYIPAICKSAKIPKQREYFFSHFEQMDIETLMKKVSKDSILLRCKIILRSLMIKMHLYKVWSYIKNKKCRCGCICDHSDCEISDFCDS